MRSTPTVLFLFGSCLLVAGSTIYGQVTLGPSGIPGDQIPDLYYYATAGVAPNGETRPAGTLTIDTDGGGFAALLVTDPDMHFLDGCILCDNGSIVEPPFNPRFYAVFNTNDYTGWFATFPLGGALPMGIFDLARGPAGLTEDYFEPIFEDPLNMELWNMRFATDHLGQFYSSVTIVPEPSSWGLSFLLGPILLRHRCRQ